jgi:hypothetical protein
MFPGGVYGVTPIKTVSIKGKVVGLSTTGVKFGKIISTGKNSRVKLLVEDRYVVSLQGNSSIIILKGLVVKLIEGVVEISVPSKGEVNIFISRIKFQLKSGIHEIDFSKSPLKNSSFYEPIIKKLEINTINKLNNLKNEKSQPQSISSKPQIEKKTINLFGKICVKRGKLRFAPSYKQICSYGKAPICKSLLPSGFCMGGDKFFPNEKSSSNTRSFFNLFLFPELVLDIVSLLPRATKAGNKKGEKSDGPAVGGSGGASMCLDSGGGSGSASNVGQTGEQSIKPPPSTRLIIKISIPGKAR